jgi:hypothetical protein
MTPKEFDFMISLVDVVSERLYMLGYEDAKAGKEPKKTGFRPSKKNQVLIKTNLEKLTKRR